MRWFLVLLLAASIARAGEPRIFSEGRSDGGELKYINDLPVLIVAGTPEEIGRQKAALTGEVVRKIADYPRQLLERANRADRLAKCLEMCKSLTPQLPADHRAEMRAFAQHSGIDNDQGVLGNLLVDVYRGGFACSSLIVDAQHSATKGPLFGRNLDFYTLGLLDKYNLVTVHRPKGKHAFVSIGFPGLFGCVSGMNDAGLALAVHEVFLARDGASMFNPKGVPYTFCFRRILEECATVEEAEKLLRATPRTTILSLALCDRVGAVVLEMTPKSVAARHAVRRHPRLHQSFPHRRTGRSDLLVVLPALSEVDPKPQARPTRRAGGGQEAQRGQHGPADGADDDFRAGRAEAAPGDRHLPVLGAADETAGTETAVCAVVPHHHENPADRRPTPRGHRPDGRRDSETL